MKRLALILFLVALGHVSVAEDSVHQLRITAANGMVPSSYIEAGPGDIVDLSADSWITGAACAGTAGCPEHVSPAEFLWSSDDRPAAVCDPYSASACVSDTDFIVSPSGVQLRVPGNFGHPITVVTRQRGTEATGTLVVTPRAHLVTPVTQVTQVNVVAQPSPVVILNRPGHWIFINGIYRWEPYGWYPMRPYHPYEYRPMVVPSLAPRIFLRPGVQVVIHDRDHGHIHSHHR